MFRELAKTVLTLWETVHRQASSLSNFSDVLRFVNEAPSRPSYHPDGVSSAEGEAVTRSAITTVEMSL